MKSIALKLPDDLLQVSDRVANNLHISRAAYMRRAIEEMNRTMTARARAARMAEASKKVRGESMKVNAEFAAVEGAPDA